ncbi:MAG TPA: hypothetical protein VGK35_03745 [Actinotalea sp.]
MSVAGGARAVGGSPQPGRCSTCGSQSLTRLPMVLADGTDVTFQSCQLCERREWLEPLMDGTWTSIPIDSVLERSARRPR